MNRKKNLISDFHFSSYGQQSFFGPYKGGELYIGVARNFVWGGPNRAACKLYKLYLYIIIDIYMYIYRWGGFTPPSRVHICHNTYPVIAAVIADLIFAKRDEHPQESYIFPTIELAIFVIFFYNVSIQIEKKYTFFCIFCDISIKFHRFLS